MSTAGGTTRLAAAALWLTVVAGISYAIGGTFAAFWWVVPAAIVWLISVRRTAAGVQRRPYGGLWCFATLFGPLSFLFLAFIFRSGAAPTSPSRRTEVADMGTDELLLRLAAVEDQVHALQHEVESIRGALRARGPVPSPVRPATAAGQVPLRTVAREPFPSAPSAPAAPRP